MTEPIGSYVVRMTDTDKRLGMPHLVESVIADEPVTKCGRRLRTRPGTSFRYSETLPIRTCSGCELHESYQAVQEPAGDRITL